MLSTLVDAVDAANGLPASITLALQAAVLEEFEENTIRIRLCTKSRRAKVRQGKNRRGSGVYGL